PMAIVAASIALGSQHTCATDGTKVRCWGGNGSGQCGTTAAKNPVTMPATVTLSMGANLTAFFLSAGETFTCGRDANNISCWGADDRLQLGSAQDGGAQSVPVGVVSVPPLGSLVSSG